MTNKTFDMQTSELAATVDETLRNLSIIEFRANEFRLACGPVELAEPNHASPSIDWRSDFDSPAIH